MLLRERNPRVITLLHNRVNEATRDPSFRGVAWRVGDAFQAPMLQALIDAQGISGFVNKDVEGYAAEVLRGLDTTLPCRSSEYLPAARRFALGCVERLTELGDYQYKWSMGDSHRIACPDWCDADETRRFVSNSSLRVGFTDIYARLCRSN